MGRPVFGGGLASNSRRPAPNSLLGRWLAGRAPHPEAFECGVRVTAGQLEQESTRWRYRRSSVDRLLRGDVVTLYHGPVTLRLVADRSLVPDAVGVGARLGHGVLAAVEQDSGAHLQISASLGELWRFGVALL
jgi:hypothetical protein